MTDAVLALNAGSSSFKFAVASINNTDDLIMSGAVERIGTDAAVMTLRGPDGGKTTLEIGHADHRSALDLLFQEIAQNDARPRILRTGHRIVHGGDQFTDPVLVTPEIFHQIEALIPLAPLHQPHGLKGISISMQAFPEAKHVACFDTAFHARKPWENTTYALPQQHFDAGIKSYGFHGLACQSICDALSRRGFLIASRKLVIAHLGNGCSVTAVQYGRSIATSMGYSTLDGLTMGTRCGRIDPGVLLHLLKSGHSVEDLERLLYHESGLLGLSGVSNDMRDLTDAGTANCEGAVSYFTCRLVEEIARLAGAMGGLDCVIFSGGIGENASTIRADVSQRLSFLKDSEGREIAVLVEPANEERQLLNSALAV